MTNQEIIEVIQAAERGEQIEYREKDNPSVRWTSAASRLYWNFSAYDYRVKPKPREFWINRYIHSAHLFGHDTQAAADASSCEERIECIHVREVLD